MMSLFKHDDSADDDFLDAIYKTLIGDGASAHVSFSDDATESDYVCLVPKREKSFVSYAKKMSNGDYAVSYDNTEYALTGNGGSHKFVYKMSQDNDGETSIYQLGYDSDDGIPVMRDKLPQHVTPICAFLQKSSMYIALNVTSKSGGNDKDADGHDEKFSGFLYIIKIDMMTGSWEPLLTTSERLNDYCTSVISKPGTGAPGILVFNCSFPTPHAMDLPRTFKELIDSLDSDDAIAAPQADVPLGLSVYDFELGAFARIPIHGRAEWGIKSVEMVSAGNAEGNMHATGPEGPREKRPLRVSQAANKHL